MPEVVFSSSPLGSVISFSSEVSHVPFLATAHQFFSSQLLAALKSSILHWLHLLISQFLIWCIWPLSPSDFSLSALLFLGCSIFSGGWLSPAFPLCCGALPFQRFSPGCWNLYPLHPNLPQAWFSVIANYYCSNSKVDFNFESNGAFGIPPPCRVSYHCMHSS